MLRNAQTLLRHVDIATTHGHYDHSEGLAATEDFGCFVDTRATDRTELNL